jgi:hypothetical protein
MRKGPHLVLYDRSNEERLSALEFGAFKPGTSSQEIIVWLWNKKDFSNAPKATDVRVSALAGNAWAEDIITGKYLKVKSNGVLDPDGVGIVDDAETEFTPIGGSLTDPDYYHLIGDIPSNCARRLFFRIDLPDGFSPLGAPRLLVQVGFLSEPVVWLYAEDS